ncbi:hypothetical protein [Pseudonocardia sp.]|uniref:hypothetical protein n=1 Tax=Pseudonocardia sp. TaxID=60912 RepID=UPI002ED7F794
MPAERPEYEQSDPAAEPEAGPGPDSGAEPSPDAEPGPDAEPDPARPDPAAVAARRRRLAELFGDVLPEATADDRLERDPSSRADERWYTENRPPHHGG